MIKWKVYGDELQITMKQKHTLLDTIRGILERHITYVYNKDGKCINKFTSTTRKMKNDLIKL